MSDFFFFFFNNLKYICIKRRNSVCTMQILEFLWVENLFTISNLAKEKKTRKKKRENVKNFDVEKYLVLWVLIHIITRSHLYYTVTITNRLKSALSENVYKRFVTEKK